MTDFVAPQFIGGISGQFTIHSLQHRGTKNSGTVAEFGPENGRSDYFVVKNVFFDDSAAVKNSLPIQC